jgi:hypothetical protein
MAQPHTVILSNPAVRVALEDAWVASAPGSSGGHEEGGFVIRDVNGNLDVVRWPAGERDSMRVPPHPNCQTGDSRIVATFHTHPNTGDDYLQEPSEN